MKQREIVLCDAVRAAISTFGGHLKAVPATELGAMVVRAALARSKLKGSDVQTIVMGNVISGQQQGERSSRQPQSRASPCSAAFGEPLSSTCIICAVAHPSAEGQRCDCKRGRPVQADPRSGGFITADAVKFQACRALT
jgi:Thiolase, N-terminal domain